MYRNSESVCCIFAADSMRGITMKAPLINAQLQTMGLKLNFDAFPPGKNARNISH